MRADDLDRLSDIAAPVEVYVRVTPGVVADTHVTLDFIQTGRATGSGSCNHYFATVETSGSSIRFGAVGATRMACGTAVSLQEVKYFEALESASRFTIEGDVLSIYGGSSRPLRFRRAAQ